MPIRPFLRGLQQPKSIPAEVIPYKDYIVAAERISRAFWHLHACQFATNFLFFCFASSLKCETHLSRWKVVQETEGHCRVWPWLCSIKGVEPTEQMVLSVWIQDHYHFTYFGLWSYLEARIKYSTLFESWRQSEGRRMIWLSVHVSFLHLIKSVALSWRAGLWWHIELFIQAFWPHTRKDPCWLDYFWLESKLNAGSKYLALVRGKDTS